MLLTVAEAAERLNLKPRRVQQFIAEGRLKARRYGRAWLIDPRALEPLMQRPGAGRPRK